MSTEFRRAAKEGNEGVVLEKMRQGMDVNAATGNGWTALVHAVVVGNVSMVRLLIGLGADIHIRTNHGESLLAKALARGHADRFHRLDPERLDDRLHCETSLRRTVSPATGANRAWKNRSRFGS